ncbi:helix-turn-helix domain containing protein [Microcella daejeonensis]|uniref:Helix-turn-helix domain containing protein n=1 Tax=Microcella daejeonensis TaxID=2994971 RepID=A0A9E8S935_9MICO|nr:TetR/AcrR family transcriptional regulator [Microcella daejeonensis]WAB81559.1 helix-turn-helix domain containing protein [Microcella daejeonensis]WAB83706.1 helix-turn-helix domain containing protein [Microcella daejeonensis]
MTETRAAAVRPRARATALAIERSAVALVLEQGYETVTVDMICARAGVSQRTFFNRFATKDAAIIGAEAPALDESAVRAFIASTGADVLGEAVGLVATAAIDAGPDPSLMLDRMRAVTSSPHLVQRQMERFAELESELAEVLRYRLERSRTPADDEASLQRQSHLAAQMLAGVMRYVAMTAIGEEPAALPATVERTRATLGQLLPKLAGTAEGTPA